MDFKSLLSQLDQLNEATKETGKGRVHTAEPGGYGRKDDEDEEGKKVKQPTEKRGRGRPKKVDAASGEDKTYDFSAFGVKKGKDVKLPKYDKSKTTKHTLKDWIEYIDNQVVLEAEQVSIIPAKTNAHVIKQGDKTLGTVTNPQLAQQIKQSIGKGEMTLAGDELGEEADYSAKKARAGKDIGKPGKQFAKIAKSAAERYGSKERGEKVAGAVLAKLRSKQNEAAMPTDDSTAGAGLGAGRSQAVLEQGVAEGKKPDFLDLDKDGNKKESMKKAAQDKKKVKEGTDHRLKSARHMGKSHALAKEGYNCKYDNMEEAKAYHEGFKEGLDECYDIMPMRGVVGEEMPATVPTMAMDADSIIDEMDMDEGNAFTGALAKERQAMAANKPEGDGRFKVGGKEFKVTAEASPFDMYEDVQIKDWSNSLESLLNENINEGVSISSSTGQQGMPDSVSITATDMDAEKVLGLIKQLGVGAFGDKAASDYGTPAAHSTGEQHGGMEVGDHDGMMALMKKVSGAEEHSHDYADEEEVCEMCHEASCKCDDKEMVDEVETEDQMTYQVAEEEIDPNNSDEASEEETDSQRDAALAKAAGDNFAKVDEEDELDESYANAADDEFTANTEFMTDTISSGLNKKKSTGQTTIPVIAGQNDRMGYNVQESILDWKALAGIK